MKTTIELSNNLLGDAIYTSFFVRRYIETHPQETVEIIIDRPSWCADIWHCVEGVRSVRAKLPDEQATITISLDVAFKHCVETYGGEREFWYSISEVNGLDCSDMKLPPIAIPPSKPLRAVYMQRTLLSPFSATCFSRAGKPANKMLSRDHWRKVFDAVHSLWAAGWTGKPLFIGAPSESMIDAGPEFELLGANFESVVAVMRSAKCLIGVDTGTVRLAHLLGTPTFYTTPVGLGRMFMPEWGAPIYHETGDPATYAPDRFKNSVEQWIKNLT